MQASLKRELINNEKRAFEKLSEEAQRFLKTHAADVEIWTGLGTSVFSWVKVYPWMGVAMWVGSPVRLPHYSAVFKANKQRVITFRVLKKNCTHLLAGRPEGCTHNKQRVPFDCGKCCEKKCPVFKSLSPVVRVQNLV